eukprot:723175-Alexandrium_andersonii.AAC.1
MLVGARPLPRRRRATAAAPVGAPCSAACRLAQDSLGWRSLAWSSGSPRAFPHAWLVARSHASRL